MMTLTLIKVRFDQPAAGYSAASPEACAPDTNLAL